MNTKPEIERKYEVPVDFALPDLTGVSGVATIGDAAEHDLDATYYDTPDLDLIRNRVTLRRRTGGTDAGWHLKRPAPAGAEGRLETQVDLSDDVPAEVADAVRDLSGGDALEPVARIRTHRTERPVRAGDGSVLALVADDRVDSEAFGGDARQEWRELEVELVDGPAPILDDIDAALRDAGARPADLPSKLARALADRYPEPGPGPLAAYLREQRDALRDTEPGVRAGDPDAVHDMRVASRRLRSTLRTFRKRLDAGNLRDELKWLGTMLGAVRDNDVMAERLDHAIAAEPRNL